MVMEPDSAEHRFHLCHSSAPLPVRLLNSSLLISKMRMINLTLQSCADGWRWCLYNTCQPHQPSHGFTLLWACSPFCEEQRWSLISPGALVRLKGVINWKKNTMSTIKHYTTVCCYQNHNDHYCYLPFIPMRNMLILMWGLSEKQKQKHFAWNRDSICLPSTLMLHLRNSHHHFIPSLQPPSDKRACCELDSCVELWGIWGCFHPQGVVGLLIPKSLWFPCVILNAQPGSWPGRDQQFFQQHWSFIPTLFSTWWFGKIKISVSQPSIRRGFYLDRGTKSLMRGHGDLPDGLSLT